MKNKEYINQEVTATFKVLDTIEEVKVNHFFKHKVLQQLNNKKEEKTSILTWFTPRIQLATLALVILLNTSAVYYVFYLKAQVSVDSFDIFGQEYSLQSETTSLLN